jgi:hypothetical protein
MGPAPELYKFEDIEGPGEERISEEEPGSTKEQTA